MAILINASTRVIAVAATGAYGSMQVKYMRQAGTNVVGFVSPGRGGTTFSDLPVFDSVEAAVAATEANTAAIYAAPFGVKAAIMECADAGLALAVAYAENVPIHDTAYALEYAKQRGMRVIGPNTVGVTSPGSALLGSIASSFTSPGSIGVIGRSGTLLLSTARLLTDAGLGQSTLVHLGGDSVTGTNPHELMQLFADDLDTSAIVYLGEIGGSKEYPLAEVIRTVNKPVFALVVGRHAPAEKRMGHAGALIESHGETAQAKREALAAAGATVCDSPMDLVERVKHSVFAVTEQGTR